ncbi:Hypothetical Protein sle_22130 [Streptomyces leeuwenhoekii]|uniref:Uncharacterized protein n=1 Tax=Streptomyces leeuwenhoekii TaxID=1437453 RepID=A0A0F7VNG1_STRLW|nr:Hypothetical Protein sle_22130 [Streptomyces leeuwenhoekii]
MAAFGGADGPGDADVVGGGGQGVVAAFAVGGADGVDRGEVDDVEAHGGDRRQAAGGGAEGAVGLVGGSLGAGEELVPGAVQGAFALHEQGHRVAGGDQFPQRVAGQDRVDLRRQRRRQPGRRRTGVVPQRRRRGPHHGTSLAVRHARGGPLVQPRALLQDDVGVDPGRNLDLRVVAPGGDRVAPRLHGVRPQAGGFGGDGGSPPVGARRQFAHGRPGAGAALWVRQHDVGGDRVVPLAEHGGRYFERLTGHGLGGPAPVLDDRAHVEDGDAPDHRGLVRGRTSGSWPVGAGRACGDCFGAGRRGCRRVVPGGHDRSCPRQRGVGG